MLLSPGQWADCRMALQLMESLRFRALIADKAYDTNSVHRAVEAQSASLEIKSKRSRKHKSAVNVGVYKRRNIIERVINRLKDYRRIATRYDKTDRNYMAFINIAAIIYNLKPTVNTA